MQNARFEDMNDPWYKKYPKRVWWWIWDRKGWFVASLVILLLLVFRKDIVEKMKGFGDPTTVVVDNPKDLTDSTTVVVVPTAPVTSQQDSATQATLAMLLRDKFVRDSLQGKEIVQTIKGSVTDTAGVVHLFEVYRHRDGTESFKELTKP